ncbi:hypothetical protein NDU88_005583 [Pleurodeles waltl]|uniref:Uncharacterized protein n=1 Tax=Pleurodeles waltl TaxID=8319 RepID=A0AAV7QG27_PLEWA|nr:hypothetical protein NDU88_005583 [Pleurodeles waltl]
MVSRSHGYEDKGPSAPLPVYEPLRRGLRQRLTMWRAARASAGLMMGRNRPYRPGTDSLAPRTQQTQSNTGAPQDLSVQAILAAHTKKFDDILRAVQSIKSTLEPKIDALCIDMGHLRKEHKKLKERVTSMEGEVTEMRPPIATTTQHVRDLQRELQWLMRWLAGHNLHELDTAVARGGATGLLIRLLSPGPDTPVVETNLLLRNAERCWFKYIRRSGRVAPYAPQFPLWVLLGVDPTQHRLTTIVWERVGITDWGDLFDDNMLMPFIDLLSDFSLSLTLP